VTKAFAEQVEEFIERYRPALEAFAITATNQDLESFALHADHQKPETPELAYWFRQHSTTIPSEKK
jgi:hypothetical protein